MDPRDAEISAIKTVLAALLSSEMRANPNLNAELLAKLPIWTPLGLEQEGSALTDQDRAQVRELVAGILQAAESYIPKARRQA